MVEAGHENPSPAPGPEAVPDVSLAIPCFNEESVLRSTVLRLARAFEEIRVDLELVLVDNGSRDRTGQIIDELVATGLPVIKRTIAVNRGYGYGILTGLAACRGRIIGFLHADGQCEARDVAKVCDVALHAARPVLVKIRRRFRMDGWRRKVTSLCYNAATNLLFPRIGSRDINGSPKVFPRECLAAMNLKSHDWFIDPEMMIRAQAVGLDVIEINVLSQMRPGGASHVDTSTCWEFVINLWRYRFASSRSRATASRPVSVFNDAQEHAVEHAD